MIEYAIPKPLPFMRLGIANMGIMLALYVLPIRQVLFLTLLKVLLQALISGTFFSYIFLFSFLGSFASVFAMILCKNLFKSKISFLGICLSGALGNNLCQILLSYLIIFKSSTGYIAPILLISGLISSLILGLFTKNFVENSIWYDSLLKDDNINAQSENLTSTQECEFDLLKKKKLNSKKFVKNLFSSFMLLLSIVFFSLLLPSGKLLFSIGSFKITQDALFLGLRRGLILILSVYISKFIILFLPPLKGKLGSFVNLIFMYFTELSTFSDKNKNSKGEKLLKKLDNHFLKVYNSDIKKTGNKNTAC